MEVVPKMVKDNDNILAGLYELFENRRHLLLKVFIKSAGRAFLFLKMTRGGKNTPLDNMVSKAVNLIFKPLVV